MHEILFRGKQVNNGEWIEGFIYEHEPPLVAIMPKNDFPELSKWYIVRTAFADWNVPRQVEFIEINPSTIGQFTGLTDKNGTMIFEGDIVKHGYTITYSNGNTNDFYSEKLVSFSNNYGGWILGNCNILTTKNINKYNIEVVGNIHDNYHILEE